ncbi:disulfide bond formation protein B [Methylomonas sp. MED-D]|uniref:disulfide bond formation protein B n=1 Tax=unclassified Methylomonas TaxID=2608980 RepID=UPI00143CBB01|nr:disulfide bond formation protein B [Methylomonas sp. MV1]MDT4330602.1 disulfide bond formation protein B [Methylomonas sp. MV1]NJA05979.1 disulfide bond formation protein B [Methylococcaceae bacterium WWC4]
MISSLFDYFSPRARFFIGFMACAGLLAVGAYLQFVEELEPCPLCISQRLAILATGLIFLAAGLHNRGRKIYAVLAAAAALIGASVSARHVWLQHLPPEEVPECSPGLEYVFQNFPLADTIKLMLSGTGECAKIDWTLLGLSIPAWTLFAFLLLATWAGLLWGDSAPRISK